MELRVLTWNVFHGRALPPAGRDLQDAFAARLAGWDWDVALLQEVPPWWPPALGAACRAQVATALTSRNAVLPVRRFLARRWPDGMKSNGGGANAILSRVGLTDVRHARLRVWPERRVAQLARIPSGAWLANYHGSTTPPRARQELARLWSLAGQLAGEDPLVLGGDLNLRAPEAPRGAVHAGARDVDHIFACRLHRSGEARVPDRSLRDGLVLSDHPPLWAALSSGPGVTASA